MALATDMRERIRLERYVEGPEGVGHGWTPLEPIWAAVEPQGDGRYRFRVRYTDDLPSTRAEIQPAMRVLYRGAYYLVDDANEAVRRTEIQLLAHRDIIEEIDHLATGTRRIKAWP